MLNSETKRRIDACRDVLVGKLPQPSNQVELITLALIYKFMDDLDEESVKLGGKRSFFTGELAKYRWRNLLPQTVSAEERVTLFSEGVEALGHLANPPFMTPKGGVTPHTKFRIAAKKAEVLFTDYIAEHLSGDGRAASSCPTASWPPRRTPT